MQHSFSTEEVTAIRFALDALGSSVDRLRRFHGDEVAQIALEGRNALFESDALRIMASKGFVEGGFNLEEIPF